MTKRARAAVLAAATLAALTLTGCVGAETVEASPTPTAVTAQPVETATPTEEPAEPVGATEAFLAWLEASRTPDADAACAALTPELVDRMLAELDAGGMGGITTCEEMITATAQMYAALGQSAEVDVEVQSETATDATLFVTYADGGDCGTVVMERTAADWVITELSEECAA